MSSFPETGNPKSKKNTFAKLQIIFASLPMHKMLLLSYKDDIRKTLHQGALTIINIVWVIFAGISLLEENSRFERKKKPDPMVSSFNLCPSWQKTTGNYFNA